MMGDENVSDHWDYFNYSNIVIEATARLKEARLHQENFNEKNTLEYWIAWSAHANAIAVAELLEKSK